MATTQGGLRVLFNSLVEDTASYLYALYYAYKDPRVPWYGRAVAGAVISYAISSIDLIPDFIPLLGQLDDAVIIPLGVLCAIRLMPHEVWEEAWARGRKRVEAIQLSPLPTSIGVILIWTVFLVLIVFLVYGVYRRLRYQA